MKCKHLRCIIIVDKRERVILTRTGETAVQERRRSESLMSVLAYCPECGFERTVGPLAEKRPKWLERLVGWAWALPAVEWFTTDKLRALAEDLRS